VKRPHSGSDVDLRGRVRREPREPAAPPVEAKFIDGPLAGQTLLVPRGQDYVTIGGFRYSWAGKDDKRTPMYCKVPAARAMQRLVAFSIIKRGRDPRVERAMFRAVPVRRTEPSKVGQGARRRAEARALRAGQAAWRASDGANGA